MGLAGRSSRDKINLLYKTCHNLNSCPSLPLNGKQAEKSQ